MSEKEGPGSQSPSPTAAGGQAQGQTKGDQSAPTTGQMRTVGQRRRDSEEKLEKHLQEARHKPAD